jgi:hypothetical protein
MMTIGRREGVVQWTRSRRVELLSINALGQLVATTLVTKKTHVMLDVYLYYRCRELTRHDLVNVGELLA